MCFTCNLSSWDLDKKSFSRSFSPSVVPLRSRDSTKTDLCFLNISSGCKLSLALYSRAHARSKSSINYFY